MLLMSPMMTFFISMISTAALALYFLVGGVVIVIQQLITNYVVTPRIRKKTDEELAKNPVKIVVTKEMLDEMLQADGTSTTSGTTANTSKQKAEANEMHKNIRELNKGKQNRNKK